MKVNKNSECKDELKFVIYSAQKIIIKFYSKMYL